MHVICVRPVLQRHKPELRHRLWAQTHNTYVEKWRNTRPALPLRVQACADQVRQPVNPSPWQWFRKGVCVTPTIVTDGQTSESAAISVRFACMWVEWLTSLTIALPSSLGTKASLRSPTLSWRTIQIDIIWRWDVHSIWHLICHFLPLVVSLSPVERLYSVRQMPIMWNNASIDSRKH